MFLRKIIRLCRSKERLKPAKNKNKRRISAEILRFYLLFNAMYFTTNSLRLSNKIDKLMSCKNEWDKLNLNLAELLSKKERSKNFHRFAKRITGNFICKTD